MEKNFDDWNKQKNHLHGAEQNKLYHQREMWWCSLGANIGFEQDGTGVEYQRPVLILIDVTSPTGPLHRGSVPAVAARGGGGG